MADSWSRDTLKKATCAGRGSIPSLLKHADRPGRCELKRENVENRSPLTKQQTNKKNWKLTSQFYCFRGPSAALSVWCRTELCCC